MATLQNTTIPDGGTIGSVSDPDALSIATGGNISLTQELSSGTIGTSVKFPSFVGMISAFAMPTAPAGWLICNGGLYSMTTYSELYAVIGTRWGYSGSSFRVPDLRGEFLRGWSNGSGADPDRNSRSAPASGGSSGDNVGSYQGSMYASHSHVPYQTSSVYDNPNNHAGGGARYGGFGYHYNTAAAGGYETRPRNKYVQYCIKYY